MMVLIIILFLIIGIQGIMIGTLKSRVDELHSQYINLDGWVSALRKRSEIEDDCDGLFNAWKEQRRKIDGKREGGTI